MKSIFLILENYYGYEEIPNPIGFKLTEAEAKEYCEKEWKFVQEARTAIVNAWVYKNTVIAPQVPLCELEARIPIIKWDSGFGGNDITEEMLRERGDIKNRNLEIEKRNRVKSNERNRIIENLFLVYLNTLVLPEPIYDALKKNCNPYSNISEYSYEEKFQL